MGWPQLELERRGGDHGGYWRLRVDHEGHYVYDSSDSNGGGTITERVCGGNLDVTLVRAWFDRISALPLVPHDGGVYSKMAREHPPATGIVFEAFMVVYRPSKDVSQMPADLDAYEQVRDEAREWFRARPQGDPCEQTERVH